MFEETEEPQCSNPFAQNISRLEELTVGQLQKLIGQIVDNCKLRQSLTEKLSTLLKLDNELIELVDEENKTIIQIENIVLDIFCVWAFFNIGIVIHNPSREAPKKQNSISPHYEHETLETVAEHTGVLFSLHYHNPILVNAFDGYRSLEQTYFYKKACLAISSTLVLPKCPSCHCLLDGGATVSFQHLDYACLVEGRFLLQTIFQALLLVRKRVV